MSFSEVLGQLLKVPGVRGAAFLDPQGETVAEVGERDSIELFGAYQSVWLSEMGHLAERAGLGKVTDFTLDFDTRRVMATQVKDGYFVLVVFDADGMASLARERVRRAVPALAAELE